MSLYDDPRCIWVAPGNDSDGEGTFASPFHSLNKALDCATPGQTVVVARGEYHGDITIEKSGTMASPIRIIAEEPGMVVWIGSCWYFYDVCDIICSGFVFKDAPGMAVSVVGSCCRNRFDTLTFIDCGMSQKGSCTFFFGGGGQTCNILESSRFIKKTAAPGSSIAVLISEGDTAPEALPNCNAIINNTTIDNYSYGILVGTTGTESGHYGHQITNNTITRCSVEGIMVKCGDTLVRDNTVQNCSGNAISMVTGTDSFIENNRIVDSGLGIRITGNGHTVTNNCIVRSAQESILVISDTHIQNPYEGTLFIESNTCVNWGERAESGMKRGLCIGSAITCIVRKNIFYGAGIPLATADSGSAEHTHFIDDNLASADCMEVPGCRKEAIVFTSLSTDDFTTESLYGAQGWILNPDTEDRDKSTSFAAAAASGEHKQDIEEESIGTNRDTEYEPGDDAYSSLYSWFGDTGEQLSEEEHTEKGDDYAPDFPS